MIQSNMNLKLQQHEHERAICKKDCKNESGLDGRLQAPAGQASNSQAKRQAQELAEVLAKHGMRPRRRTGEGGRSSASTRHGRCEPARWAAHLCRTTGAGNPVGLLHAARAAGVPEDGRCRRRGMRRRRGGGIRRRSPRSFLSIEGWGTPRR
jgi:hypothetical protein